MTTEAKKKPEVRSATIKLEGKSKSDFEIVKSHCTDTLPGIIPDNADVMRYALHLAAQAAKNESN